MTGTYELSNCRDIKSSERDNYNLLRAILALEKLGGLRFFANTRVIFSLDPPRTWECQRSNTTFLSATTYLHNSTCSLAHALSQFAKKNDHNDRNVLYIIYCRKTRRGREKSLKKQRFYCTPRSVGQHVSTDYQRPLF